MFHTKCPDTIRLTCLKALSRKELNRLERNASISKPISKRKTRNDCHGGKTRPDVVRLKRGKLYLNPPLFAWNIIKCSKKCPNIEEAKEFQVQVQLFRQPNWRKWKCPKKKLSRMLRLSAYEPKIVFIQLKSMPFKNLDSKVWDVLNENCRFYKRSKFANFAPKNGL